MPIIAYTDTEDPDMPAEPGYKKIPIIAYADNEDPDNPAKPFHKKCTLYRICGQGKLWIRLVRLEFTVQLNNEQCKELLIILLFYYPQKV